MRLNLVKTPADAVLIGHDLHQQAVVVDVRRDQHPKQGQRNRHNGNPVGSRKADLDVRVFDCHYVPHSKTPSVIVVVYAVTSDVSNLPTQRIVVDAAPVT